MTNHRRRWLPAEDDYLRENAECSRSLVARELGRTEGAVKMRAHRLGITGEWSGPPSVPPLDSIDPLEAVEELRATIASLLVREVAAA